MKDEYITDDAMRKIAESMKLVMRARDTFIKFIVKVPMESEPV